MIFLKRLIIGALAIGFIYLGGSGTQSSNVLAQGGGFIGILIGLVVVYIFFKMAWRAMGCLPSFIIFSVVVLFILYAIGAFANGVNGIGSYLKSFIGQDDGAKQEEVELFIPHGSVKIEEDFTAPAAPSPATAPATTPQPEQSSGLGGLFNKLTGNSQAQNTHSFDILSYPLIYGVPKVINANTIALQSGGYITLFGVDAPDLGQTCANKQGRSYHCGNEAAMWLKGWITGNSIECRVLKRDTQNNILGICFLGEYDIGAALINSGWAVADTTSTAIYVPYEEQAMQNRRGLWQGEFYRPADWRIMQSKRPNIKVIKPKKTKKGILDV